MTGFFERYQEISGQPPVLDESGFWQLSRDELQQPAIREIYRDYLQEGPRNSSIVLSAKALDTSSFAKGSIQGTLGHAWGCVMLPDDSCYDISYGVNQFFKSRILPKELTLPRKMMAAGLMAFGGHYAELTNDAPYYNFDAAMEFFVTERQARALCSFSQQLQAQMLDNRRRSATYDLFAFKGENCTTVLEALCEDVGLPVQQLVTSRGNNFADRLAPANPNKWFHFARSVMQGEEGAPYRLASEDGAFEAQGQAHAVHYGNGLHGVIYSGLTMNQPALYYADVCSRQCRTEGIIRQDEAGNLQTAHAPRDVSPPPMAPLRLRPAGVLAPRMG
jgi:hypothetical protein